MVDLKLVSYIKENKKRGYGRDELIKILRENGWSREEIKLAYKFIEKNKKALIKKPAISYTKEKDPLLKFIDNSLNEGISEREIRLALSIKGWKQEKVNDSFKKVKFPVIVQRKEEKPQEPQKQKINFKSIIKYLFYFLVLSFILSGTSLVYLYIQGMEDYSITNVAGEELTKTCLEKDCSDMKQHAINYIYNSYMAYILVSLILSLFMLVTYGVLPYKSRILWVYNFLYFLVLVFIVYTWIMFQGV
jgi:magnesium-transporting ATPase (P-type)